jgi:hypothetical protein
MTLDIQAIYRPFLIFFRTKRMNQFCEIFAINDQTRVIDVGGYEMNWQLAKTKPKVLLVNLEAGEWERGRFSGMQGDGRHLVFGDDSFDIAYSNSVIEHVGGWEDQVAFANEIRRVAPEYYVQTPNRRFFFEPHLIAPFVHYLPRRFQGSLARYFTVWGLVTKPSRDQVDGFLDSIRLLNKTELQMLFPDARIIEEKFLGLVKSIIAVRAKQGRNPEER